ncbi:IclR family transcriptional regulator C-terminal domain-containing protein [Bradyrhizobium sp. SSUT18]|uniref:IclR family transcriptional regulator n=1 Tax=Bradyrhizobium sp. SSUT18 TaxID=3040602 RepID=UPI00244C0177|nr:IclR family transcriptional regulator C-terminal domain-containing protein [Bradyrhizobium sp. SSUT18]MDH2406577.1 IclR family transcriptional regulator C-terminal domain-containing protein [Bradyrhizobium sp. SSUT18]
MPSYEPVRAIQRGLAVLRAVSEHGPVTIADLVSRCGFPQPTVVRVLETLVGEGYVYRQAGKSTYLVTGRTLALSRGFDAKSRLLEIAAPIVDQMHIKIGWPSNLAIFDRDAMVIVYSNRASLGLSLPGRTGARIPLMATGVGLVTLAFMPEEERKIALSRARETGGRWDNDPRLASRFAMRLAQIRRDGHAFADEEYLEAVYQSRIWAVAVPILTNDGKVLAAISSLVLTFAGERRRLLQTLLPSLRKAAVGIRDRLVESGK